MQKKQEYNERRAELSKLSTKAREIRQMMPLPLPLNQIILALYAEREGKTPEEFKKMEFGTFKSWQEKGYKVKKGSKGYAIWSRPKNELGREKKPDAPQDEEGAKFFGIAYLFSCEQVEKN